MKHKLIHKCKQTSTKKKKQRINKNFKIKRKNVIIWCENKRSLNHSWISESIWAKYLNHYKFPYYPTDPVYTFQNYEKIKKS